MKFLFFTILFLSIANLLSAQDLIQFDSTTINLGIMDAGPTKSGQLRFKNTGDAPIKIISVRSSDGGFHAYANNRESVLPNKYGLIKYQYSTKSRIGNMRRTIVIKYNYKGKEYEAKIAIKGEVAKPKPRVNKNEITHDMGTISDRKKEYYINLNIGNISREQGTGGTLKILFRNATKQYLTFQNKGTLWMDTHTIRFYTRDNAHPGKKSAIICNFTLGKQKRYINHTGKVYFMNKKTYDTIAIVNIKVKGQVPHYPHYKFNVTHVKNQADYKSKKSERTASFFNDSTIDFTFATLQNKTNDTISIQLLNRKKLSKKGLQPMMHYCALPLRNVRSIPFTPPRNAQLYVYNEMNSRCGDNNYKQLLEPGASITLGVFVQDKKLLETFDWNLMKVNMNGKKLDLKTTIHYLAQEKE